MASKKKPSAPLTFDLSTGLLRKIEDYRKKAGVRSKSEVIRDAIEMYDYAGFSREVEPHRQISVRLPVGQKRELARVAKQKKVSLGELLRVALQALPENPEKKETNGEPVKATRATKTRTTARKAAPKKGPVKKTAGKAALASKTTAKRAPAKRAATKSAPTRAAARQATTQRATTGKAPARKTAARKASSPRTASRKK